MKRTIIAAIVILYNVLNADAQEKQIQPLKLTYKEAAKIALKNNLNLNQQKNNLIASQVQRNQSVAAFLPSVGIQGEASHTDGQQPNPDGGELQNLSVENVSANIQAEVMLFNGFNR